jgi:hypothetical protein
MLHPFQLSKRLAHLLHRIQLLILSHFQQTGGTFTRGEFNVSTTTALTFTTNVAPATSSTYTITCIGMGYN